MRLWETPVPMPNTTVKTQAADDTWLETARESKWLPELNKSIIPGCSVAWLARLISARSVVRVHLSPFGKIKIIWGFSSVGRAPALQAGGREFESRNLH